MPARSMGNPLPSNRSLPKAAGFRRRIQNSLPAALIVGLGCLQMVGDVFDLPAVKALGAISHVSPAPKVFTTQRGFETFSSTFALHAWDGQQAATTLPLTPEVNAQVRGPYNRRNAYGAALSYGPVLADSTLTALMFNSVLRFGLCGRQGVAADLGVAGRRYYAVDIVPRAFGEMRAETIRFEVDCLTGAIRRSGS